MCFHILLYWKGKYLYTYQKYWDSNDTGASYIWGYHQYKIQMLSKIDCQWASSKANLVGSQDVKYTSKFHGSSHTARLKANKSTGDKQNSETWCTTDSSFESETDWGSNITAPCFPYMFSSRTSFFTATYHASSSGQILCWIENFSMGEKWLDILATPFSIFSRHLLTEILTTEYIFTHLNI